jgi:hypothetical protein
MVVVDVRSWDGGAAAAGEIEDGNGADAWDVVGTITPGDAVGSVTERLLNVCGACVAVMVGFGVVEITNELDDGTGVVAMTVALLALVIPRMLAAALVSKQPT